MFDLFEGTRKIQSLTSKDVEDMKILPGEPIHYIEAPLGNIADLNHLKSLGVISDEYLTKAIAHRTQLDASMKAWQRDVEFIPQKGKLGEQGYLTADDPRIQGLSVHVEPDKITLINLQASETGKGIGSKVINRVKQMSEESGKPIELTARPDSPELQDKLNKFYEKHGFKNVGGNEFRYTPAKTLDPFQEMFRQIGESHARGKDLWSSISGGLQWLKSKYPEIQLPTSAQHDIAEAIGKAGRKVHTDTVPVEQLKEGKRGQRELGAEYKQRFSKKAQAAWLREELEDAIDLSSDKPFHEMLENWVRHARRIGDGTYGTRSVSLLAPEGAEQLTGEKFTGNRSNPKEVSSWVQDTINRIFPLASGNEVHTSGNVLLITQGGDLKKPVTVEEKADQITSMLSPSKSGDMGIIRAAIGDEMVDRLLARHDNSGQATQETFMSVKLHELGFDRPDEIRKEWAEYREDVYDKDPALGWYIDKHYRWKEAEHTYDPSAPGTPDPSDYKTKRAHWEPYEVPPGEIEPDALKAMIKDVGEKYKPMTDAIQDGADCLTKHIL